MRPGTDELEAQFIASYWTPPLTVTKLISCSLVPTHAYLQRKPLVRVTSNSVANTDGYSGRTSCLYISPTWRQQWLQTGHWPFTRISQKTGRYFGVVVTAEKIPETDSVFGALQTVHRQIYKGWFNEFRIKVVLFISCRKIYDFLDSWIKIDQFDVTCFIISLFNAQHVSNVSTSIFRRLRLIVDLFHVLYCSGSMCVGVTVWFGWGGVVSLCRLMLCFGAFLMF